MNPSDTKEQRKTPLLAAAAPRRASIADVFQWRSLKTRVTLLTLSVFVIGIWLSALYASRTLREDMQRLLGEQQFSTVSLVAADINHELNDRLSALDIVAAGVGAAMAANAATLQALLEQRPILPLLFNGGVFITRIDGTALASIPLAAGRRRRRKRARRTRAGCA